MAASQDSERNKSPIQSRAFEMLFLFSPGVDGCEHGGYKLFPLISVIFSFVIYWCGAIAWSSSRLHE